jgi:hypothetical protein
LKWKTGRKILCTVMIEQEAGLKNDSNNILKWKQEGKIYSGKK